MEDYIINIEGMEIVIEISKHAADRMEERDVDKYGVYGLLLKMGENLLDLKNGEEFAIVDKDLQTAIVCCMYAEGVELRVEVITAIAQDKVFISRGTRVFKLTEEI